jgi:8-oxo-dGTP diphosphatase
VEPDPPRSVVGAAILREGRVLAARRTSPPRAAGRWEFPGGKVEPGETPESALAREVTEELGCPIEVIGWLEGQVTIDSAHVLSVGLARLLDGEPHAVEHDLVRWLAADELGEVDWLASDLPFLAELRDTLLADEEVARERGRP